MEASPAVGLSEGAIRRTFWPLALSWLFMSADQPLNTAAISHKANSEANTAALLILLAIAYWIESPIIDLLSTSTTLCSSRASYRTLRGFTFALLGLVTLVHLLAGFTPIFDVVVYQLLGVTREVGEAARVPLQILTLWSAVIGWRRFNQGLLIRSHRARLISVGTVVRMVSMSASLLALSFGTSRLSGIIIASISLMIGVSCEAAYVTFAARSAIRELPEAPDEAPLTLSRLCRFHFPLTATTMVNFLGMSVVSAALARAASPVLTLAAYQVASSFLWAIRSSAYALPEIVITLARDEASAARLRRFSVSVGAWGSAIVAALYVTGGAYWYFHRALGSTEAVSRIACIAFIFGVLLPVIACLQGYYRGMLTALHRTSARLIAMGVYMTALAASLVLLIGWGVDGARASGIAGTVALALELWILYALFKKAAREVGQPAQVSVI